MKNDLPRRNRLLEVIYYQTAFCAGVALTLTAIAAIPLGAVFFRGKDSIVWGWNAIKGESVSSLKAILFTMVLVGVFSGSFRTAYRLSDKYIRAKTEESRKGAHNQAL